MQKRFPGFGLLRGAACAAAAILCLAAAPARAQDGVVGKWEVAQDFNGQTNYNELKIDKEGAGLKATWNGTPLTDVKFEGDKLTFVRSVNFGGNESKMSYTGTLKDGKLTGSMGSDFGEFTSTARRPAPLSPAVGAWKLGDAGILKISQDVDGKLAGKLGADKDAITLTDLKFDAGKLSFKQPAKAEGAAAATFEGTIKDGKLEGTLKGDKGETKVSADPLGAKLAGEWNLEGEFGFGGNSHKLVIFPDLTGRYQMFDGLSPVGDVKIDGDQVAWQVKMSFGENDITFGFTGKLDGDTLNGKITNPQGDTEVKGKRAPKS